MQKNKAAAALDRLKNLLQIAFSEEHPAVKDAEAIAEYIEDLENELFQFKAENFVCDCCGEQYSAIRGEEYLCEGCGVLLIAGAESNGYILEEENEAIERYERRLERESNSDDVRNREFGGM